MAIFANTLAAEEGVERPAPGLAPSAFRIWRAGPNTIDKDGKRQDHYFTPKSAELLMVAQAVRENRFSIDVDHMSLNTASPPESRKAVGWHSLEVRDSQTGPELWATQVEWTPAVKSGLETSPPEWRYFSPAYDVDAKTGEIIAYLNTALTNNPATRGVTALASRIAANTVRTGGSMDFKGMAAALAGDDDEKKSEARAWLSKASDSEKKAWKAWKKAAFEHDEPDGDEKKEAAKASEEGEEAKKAASDAEEVKKATKASEEEKKEASIAASLASLPEMKEFRDFVAAQKKSAEKQEIKSILATRTDLDKATRDWLETQPLSVVQGAAKTLPRTQRVFSIAATAANTLPDTVGANQGDLNLPLASEDAAVLDRVFGNAGQSTGLVIGGGDVVAAQRHLAARKLSADNLESSNVRSAGSPVRG